MDGRREGRRWGEEEWMKLRLSRCLAINGRYSAPWQLSPNGEKRKVNWEDATQESDDLISEMLFKPLLQFILTLRVEWEHNERGILLKRLPTFSSCCFRLLHFLLTVSVFYPPFAPFSNSKWAPDFNWHQAGRRKEEKKYRNEFPVALCR